MGLREGEREGRGQERAGERLEHYVYTQDSGESRILERLVL